MKQLAYKESSFNPKAVNTRQGVKTKYGLEHAQGIMQMLPSTFNEHALPGMTDIKNPVHNFVSSIGYIRRRYKHPQVALSGWARRKGY